MLLAGHETTANTIAWALYLLATHPAVEGQVVREMEAVLGGRDVAADDLERLPFTEQVLLETMRLYPTAFMVGRKALTEVELGGFRLPAGTTVFMSQWVVHRDPRFFDRPDQFDPARWAEGPRSLPGRAYFPFGAGPRLCIGAQFALVEATVLLATLLPRYRLRLVDGAVVAPWPSITLRPRGGVPVEVRRRDGLPALWG
jgi:cytochrome P450